MVGGLISNEHKGFEDADGSETNNGSIHDTTIQGGSSSKNHTNGHG